MAPRSRSSMPRGGAAAVLRGWLFERLDDSQSRVPATPQQRRDPEVCRRPCLAGGLWGRKGPLAKQRPFPVRRAEAAGNHHPRERILAWCLLLQHLTSTASSRVSPRRRASFFCIAKRKKPKKRQPAARRIPATAAPPKARLKLAARYRRAASNMQPLNTLDGPSVSARADGTGPHRFCCGFSKMKHYPEFSTVATPPFPRPPRGSGRKSSSA